MKGAGIGTLNVYLRGQNDTATNMRKIWTLSGEQASGQWFSGQAPIVSLTDYQVNSFPYSFLPFKFRFIMTTSVPLMQASPLNLS